jgi:hypothetical protein
MMSGYVLSDAVDRAREIERVVRSEGLLLAPGVALEVKPAPLLVERTASFLHLL